MSEEKPKEGVKTENDHVNLKVAGQDGSVVQFKIQRHTPLSKLMKACCERQGLSVRQIRFRFDGQPINETDTPGMVSRGPVPNPGRPSVLALLLSGEHVTMLTTKAPAQTRGHSPQ
uniref:Small ubiquitin-related modifier 2 n=1 Tax=Mandrillus leucophaeus TaxID=9568 RepID=A0A2K5Z9J9_MANLE